MKEKCLSSIPSSLLVLRFSNLYHYLYPKIQGEDEVKDEYNRGDFFSGRVLSTLFGDDVPNGTPINFDEEDPRLPQEVERAGKCRSESRPTF